MGKTFKHYNNNDVKYKGKEETSYPISDEEEWDESDYIHQYNNRKKDGSKNT